MWLMGVIVGGVAGVCGSDSVEVDFQPLAAQTKRVVEAFEFLGEPIAQKLKAELEAAWRPEKQDQQASARIQSLLDSWTLAEVTINPESRVRAVRGSEPARLIQQGWRNFLIKVVNEAGVTSKLIVTSPQAETLVKPGTNRADPPSDVTMADVPLRFLDVDFYNKQPLEPKLSGLKVEYRILQIYCRDAGKREATLSFSVGPGTQDLGFRADTHLLFEAEKAVELSLGVKDHDGTPTTASFTFRDRFGRVYPSQTRRLAPDFFFHPQVYRKDGETVMLPAGDYDVETTRGPEYRITKRKIEVLSQAKQHADFKLARWIELKKRGWWSGDHHIHGAGCSHYDQPTQGVTPADMFRHIVGEDLNVGCVLSWGPCWYHQKNFFDGKTHPLSLPDYLMRYDVEVSGFPSSHCGHLCLLNLKEDDYPNCKRLEDWPSWNLPVLKWAKSQGAVVGFSHSAPGLEVPTFELPNYIVPPMDGIGANEYIVDVAHDACDFISTVDTQAPWELNIWYHTLNCGFRAKISGETDFPCIFGQRVGIGRSYVHLPKGLDFSQWAEGIKAGRSYVSDGYSHLMNFRANDMEAGFDGGVLKLDQPQKIRIRADVAAMLEPQPNETIQKTKLSRMPYWHIERARIGAGNRVPVEVVVNGRPVAQKEVVGDGTIREIEFDLEIDRSSWVALRIYPSSHTNPIFVEVAKKPIRASKKSAEWCAKCVDQCWLQKSRQIRGPELKDAKAAFDAAKTIYTKIAGESFVD